jgi:uncharacterized membrane protein
MYSHAADEERPPISQLFVSLPIGLWLFSLGADVMYRSGRGPASWDDVAFFTMFAALVVALLTAVPGFIDELAGTLPPRGRSDRLWLNLAIIALYAVNLCLRTYVPGALLPVCMSVFGIALLAVSGWLGGELGHPQAAGAARLCLRTVRIEAGRGRTARSARSL